MPDHDSNDKAIIALATSPEGICFAASQQGLRISRDAGETWQPTMTEADGIAVTAISLSPNFSEDRTLFAAIPGAIAQSSDAGVMWEFTGVPLPLQIISEFAISPDFANDRTIFAATTDDGILRSEDGGASWQAWNFGLLDHNVLSLAISPGFPRDRMILAGSSSGLFHSVNGGKSWQAIDLDCGFAEITEVISVSDSGFLALADESSLYRSIDHGRTWTNVSVPSATLQTIAAGPDVVVAITDVDIFRSCDQGETWESTARGPDSVTTAIPIGDDRLLIGTASGNVRTFGLS